MPAWWRGSELLLYRDVAIWLRGLWRRVEGAADDGGASMVARSRCVSGRDGRRVRAGTMIALTIGWTLARRGWAQRRPRRSSRSCAGLGSERHPLLLTLPTLRRVCAEECRRSCGWNRVPRPRPEVPGQNDRPLYQVAAVPAGRYRLQPRGAATAGWLMIGIGRDQFSLISGPLTNPPQSIEFDFPVDVRAIVVRGDEQARRSVHGLTIEPILGRSGHIALVN